MALNTPPKVDILGAESVAWYAAVVMTTELGFTDNASFSPSQVFHKLINTNGVKTRSNRPVYPLGCHGSVLEVSEDMLKRTCATKHVRTALHTLFQTWIEFQNECSSSYVVKGEFKIGSSMKFTSKHDVTNKMFREIQKAVMSSYQPQHFLKPPSDPVPIDVNRLRYSNIIPISLNSHSEASSSGS